MCRIASCVLPYLAHKQGNPQDARPHVFNITEFTHHQLRVYLFPCLAEGFHAQCSRLFAVPCSIWSCKHPPWISPTTTRFRPACERIFAQLNTTHPSARDNNIHTPAHCDQTCRRQGKLCRVCICGNMFDQHGLGEWIFASLAVSLIAGTARHGVQPHQAVAPGAGEASTMSRPADFGRDHQVEGHVDEDGQRLHAERHRWWLQDPIRATWGRLQGSGDTDQHRSRGEGVSEGAAIGTRGSEEAGFERSDAFECYRQFQLICWNLEFDDMLGYGVWMPGFRLSELRNDHTPNQTNTQFQLQITKYINPRVQILASSIPKPKILINSFQTFKVFNPPMPHKSNIHLHMHAYLNSKRNSPDTKSTTSDIP